MEYDLTRYVKLMMSSEFPANELLTSPEFVKYLAARGLSISEKELEFFDKLEILRPVMRLSRPKVSDKDHPAHKYHYIETGFYALQEYFSMGLVQFPQHGDFRSWAKYSNEYEDVDQYYHPYQILMAEEIYRRTRYVLTAESLQNKNVAIQYVDHLAKGFHELVPRILGLQSKLWMPRIGLLMLLDDYYGRWVRNAIPYNIYDLSSLSERRTKLKEWAAKFSPNHALMMSCMKLDEIEKFYRTLALHTIQIDPLSEWFIFQQMIRQSRRYALRNQALLAQDYYGFLFMIGSFIYDLSGKKMPEPNSIMHSGNGGWKEKIFGKPFDVTTKQTQNQLLKYFLIDRPLELVIIVEGETEEKIIELILKARNVDLEKDGFFVYNIKGQDNLEHLKPLFRVSQLIDITIFAMLDNDKDVDKRLDKMKLDAKSLGYTKDILVRKWDRDFETENFGISAVVTKVNKILEEKGYKTVDRLEVEKRMESNGEALIRAIENTIGKTNIQKLDSVKKISDIIPKPQLASQLINDRLKEIQIDDNPEWNAKLPIEIELRKVFRLIPQHS